MKKFQSSPSLVLHLSSLKVINNSVPFSYKKYEDYISYDCGCGSVHQANGNDGSLPIGREARLGVHALYKCHNNWLTYIQIKGFFKMKTNSLWALPYDLYETHEKLFQTNPSAFLLHKKWIIFGVAFMVENDHLYHNLLLEQLTSTESDSSTKEPIIDTESIDYLCGKFLFRTFAFQFAIIGGALEGKLSNSKALFEDLQNTLKIASIMGINHDGALDEYAEYPSLHLHSLPFKDMLPIQGRGEEFADESLPAITEYFKQNDVDFVSEELVKLFHEALRFCIKDLDEKSLTPKAMSIFADAKKIIFEHLEIEHK